MYDYSFFFKKGSWLQKIIVTRKVFFVKKTWWFQIQLKNKIQISRVQNSFFLCSFDGSQLTDWGKSIIPGYKVIIPRSIKGDPPGLSLLHFLNFSRKKRSPYAIWGNFTHRKSRIALKKKPFRNELALFFNVITHCRWFIKSPNSWTTPDQALTISA